MATKTHVILVDDVDGREATQTIAFAYQGAAYEIDLNDDHASALEESFADWISSARRMTGSSQRSSKPSAPPRSTSAPRSNLGPIRDWLRENGHSVSERGRISAEMMQAYDAAH